MSESQYQIPLERIANVPVTEGMHLFTITAGEEGEGNKGPYWQFTCACQTPSEAGKTVRMFVSLSQQARWRLEIFLDALQAPSKGAATIDKFIGRSFRGNVTHQIYEGRKQANIGEIFPANGGPAAQAPKPVIAAQPVVRAAAEPTVMPQAVQAGSVAQPAPAVTVVSVHAPVAPATPAPVQMPLPTPATEVQVDTQKGLPADSTMDNYTPPF